MILYKLFYLNFTSIFILYFFSNGFIKKKKSIFILFKKNLLMNTNNLRFDYCFYLENS